MQAVYEDAWRRTFPGEEVPQRGNPPAPVPQAPEGAEVLDIAELQDIAGDGPPPPSPPHEDPRPSQRRRLE